MKDHWIIVEKQWIMHFCLLFISLYAMFDILLRAQKVKTTAWNTYATGCLKLV